MVQWPLPPADNHVELEEKGSSSLSKAKQLKRMRTIEDIDQLKAECYTLLKRLHDATLEELRWMHARLQHVTDAVLPKLLNSGEISGEIKRLKLRIKDQITLYGDGHIDDCVMLAVAEPLEAAMTEQEPMPSAPPPMLTLVADNQARAA